MSAAATVFENLAVSQVMLPGVVTCHPDDPASRIAASMVIHDVRAVRLQTPGGAALFVSDLDLVRAVLTAPPETPARRLASEHAATVSSDAPVADAVAKMSELYADHALVVDPESGEPSGVLSSFDIVAAIAGGRPRRTAARVTVPTRAPADADRLSTTTVATVMQMGVVSCQPQVSIATVARCMAERHIHCVAVGGVGVDGRREGHFEWGLIDDMDIVQAANRRALTEPAGSIAVEAPLAVTEFDSIEHAATLMVDEGSRHVVVIGAEGLPAGMVSTRDVAWMVASLPRPPGADH
jgi:CBS domain-containing protein